MEQSALATVSEKERFSVQARQILSDFSSGWIPRSPSSLSLFLFHPLLRFPSFPPIFSLKRKKKHFVYFLVMFLVMLFVLVYPSSWFLCSVCMVFIYLFIINKKQQEKENHTTSDISRGNNEGQAGQFCFSNKLTLDSTMWFWYSTGAFNLFQKMQCTKLKLARTKFQRAQSCFSVSLSFHNKKRLLHDSCLFPPKISMSVLMEAIIVTHTVCVRTTMDHFPVSAKADFLEVASTALVRVSY